MDINHDPSPKRGKLTLAIDVGGTRLKAGLLDDNGDMVAGPNRVNTPPSPVPEVVVEALVGLAGPWLIVLAPAAGLAGRAAAKNLVRQARYHLLCRHQIIALENAVRRHCAASRDAVETNITAAKAQADKFRSLHSASSGPVQDCISDWLDRVQHIQDFRRLQADRLHRASNDPAVLDTNGGDPIVVAQESLLTCARVGLHPANVATTTQDVVAASKALVKRMETLSI